ncbi:MAG: NADH-quinone oxidoreductase subunit NuoH [Thiovulaceae bacterium]|nr:NADH-quinone oxidoreductase subunit NuoH [Sulfurimonadaceae bacterium]
METSIIIETLIKMVVVVLIFSALAGFGTYFERRLLGFFHRRLGPNMVGPFGLLQIIADGIKLFTKEDIIPANAVKGIFVFATLVIPVAAFVAFTAIPLYPQFTVFGYTVHPIIIDVNVGLLFVMGVMAVGMYTPLLAGMSSGNKWSLIGAARGVIQLLSFEVITGLSILAPLMMVGSLSLIDINQYQVDSGMWLIVQQPVAFILFTIAGFAEVNRTPFDLTENESEIIAGYHTEYSGMKYGLMAIGEYASMFIVAFLVSIIFLGGYGDASAIVNGEQNGAWGGVFLLLKVAFFFFFFIWTRATWPHIRPDQLMWLCWKVLMPLAVLNIVITGFVMMLNQ